MSTAPAMRNRFTHVPSLSRIPTSHSTSAAAMRTQSMTGSLGRRVSRSAGRRSRRMGQHLEQTFYVLSGLHARKDMLDAPVGADHERRSLDAHVAPAVVVLLDPHAEGLRDAVIRIGQEAVRQGVLALEADVALDGVG